MEVCKIKKQGFPFRESYEAFWARSVARDFHTVLHLPANMEPREGTEIICKNALPATIVDEAGNTMPFWTMGKQCACGNNKCLAQTAKHAIWCDLSEASLIVEFAVLRQYNGVWKGRHGRKTFILAHVIGVEHNSNMGSFCNAS